MSCLLKFDSSGSLTCSSNFVFEDESILPTFVKFVKLPESIQAICFQFSHWRHLLSCISILSKEIRRILYADKLAWKFVRVNVLGTKERDYTEFSRRMSSIPHAKTSVWSEPDLDNLEASYCLRYLALRTGFSLDALKFEVGRILRTRVFDPCLVMFPPGLSDLTMSGCLFEDPDDYFIDALTTLSPSLVKLDLSVNRVNATTWSKSNGTNLKSYKSWISDGTVMTLCPLFYKKT